MTTNSSKSVLARSLVSRFGMSDIESKSTPTLWHAFLSVRSTCQTRSVCEKYSVCRNSIVSLSVSFKIIVDRYRYEEININLVEKPEWYLKKNPPGQVPALEWIDEKSNETRFVPESLVVSDFLDEKYPQTRLQPTDPYQKAQHRVLVERFSGVSQLSSPSFDLLLLPGCLRLLQNFPL